MDSVYVLCVSCWRGVASWNTFNIIAEPMHSPAGDLYICIASDKIY